MENEQLDSSTLEERFDRCARALLKEGERHRITRDMAETAFAVYFVHFFEPKRGEHWFIDSYI